MEIADNPTRLPIKKAATYEDLLESILLQIVDVTEELDVVEVEDEEYLRFQITAHKTDHGKIIGKQGTTIGALHKLFSTITRGRPPVKIDIKDCSPPTKPNGGLRERPSKRTNGTATESD